MARSVKLSICIPTYNRGDYIGETLEHIMKQTTDEVEVVIVDGASTDQTRDVIDELQLKYRGIRYFRQSVNGGIDMDMARTIDLAQGEYCWLFGSDDIMRDGAISNILSEISKGLDLYLCGFTLCTRQMIPIADHHIWSVNQPQHFELSDVTDRTRYFEIARTTTAFFSFLGSIIVRREKWLQSDGHANFIGTCWAHVARLFALIPSGLSIKTIPNSLLLNRGDNDSFMERGRVNRIGISIHGYLDIGEHFFGKTSLEAKRIKDVLRYEWPLIEYVKLYNQLPVQNLEEKHRLTEIFHRCFSGANASSRICRVIYTYFLTRTAYILLDRLKRRIKVLIQA